MPPRNLLSTGAVLVVLAAAATAACASDPSPTVASGRQTAVAALVVQVCQGCHGPEVLAQKGRSKEEWAAVVQTMVERGAMASDQDLMIILDYLAKTYPADQRAAGG